MVFDDVRVPVSNMLGERGDGFKIAMRTLDKTRIPVAAGAVGVLRRALDESRKYAGEREAFGRPIGQFQAIQFKLANMKIALETARWQTWYAAWLADNGRPHAKPPPSPRRTPPTARSTRPRRPSTSSVATAT